LLLASIRLACSRHMRIRVIQRPTERCIDGVPLDHLEPGFHYDVCVSIANVFLAEGWAEPVPVEEPALVLALEEVAAIKRPSEPFNLVRDSTPLAFTRDLAADFRSRRHHRRR
jgi:hypothetical protein